MNKRNGGANQRWKVVYVDKAAETETKGLNEEFGFFINRPFYIRSRMPMERVMEVHGAAWTRLNRWRKNVKSQQFYFDEKTKTVRSNHWKNYAIAIYSNGGHPYISATSGVNSRWW